MQMNVASKCAQRIHCVRIPFHLLESVKVNIYNLVRVYYLNNEAKFVLLLLLLFFYCI